MLMRNVSVAALVLMAASYVAAQSSVTADFGIGADYPLVKSKFNLFDTSLPTTAAFDRDVPLLSSLRAENMRVDLSWGQGQTLSKAVEGQRASPQYDFSLVDRYSRAMLKAGVLPYWSYDYTPYPLIPPGAGAEGWNRMPDLAAWSQVVTAFAKHFRESGIPVAVHEVWNEPDNRDFFTGGVADYERLYAAGVAAMRAGDPDAVVAGPTVATEDWYKPFSEYVVEHHLPLDVFTFHHYGSPALDEVSHAAASLSRFHELDTTEMGMDEYQSADLVWLPGGPQDRYQGATELLHDFATFLERPELTSISWAQFQDPCACKDQYLGLVSLDGKIKAAYNGFRVYSEMQVDRNRVEVSGSELEAMASSDAHNADLVVLNRTLYDRRFDAVLKDLPFSSGKVKLYWIDKSHGSAGDGAEASLSPSEELSLNGSATWTRHVSLMPGAVLYVHAEDGSGVSELTDVRLGKILRTLHYYPSRTTKAYADFDRRTWIARLGMSGEQRAEEMVGVTAESLPSSLHVLVKSEGDFKKINNGSLLGVRVDYAEGAGYTKSVLFHGASAKFPDLYSKAREGRMPWGTEKKETDAVEVKDLSDFRIELKKYAPKGWSGRVQLTFVQIDTGRGTRAKFLVR